MRSQRDNLVAAGKEQSVACYGKCADSLLYKALEGCVDLRFVSGTQDMQPSVDCLGGLPEII